MHLRQDLERVRNLCYMVSRREKLKLLQSKAQEQLFGLHVKLMDQEFTAGLPTSFPVENTLFRPPPRITLKLKMPKTSCQNGNLSSKTGNGPLCPDNSVNVTEQASGAGLGQGKPLLHAQNHKEERSNGRLPSSGKTVKPSGKPLALHAALQGRPSNGKHSKESKACKTKSNGILEKYIAQKDSACQTKGDSDAKKTLEKASFRQVAIEHFGKSFKEATISLVRATEGMNAGNLSKKGSAKEKLCAKAVAGHKVKSTRDSDGYCPDLELSDSETEAKVRHKQHQQQMRTLPEPGTKMDSKKGLSGVKQAPGSRQHSRR